MVVVASGSEVVPELTVVLVPLEPVVVDELEPDGTVEAADSSRSVASHKRAVTLAAASRTPSPIATNAGGVDRRI
ncbi:MAG: hypothetical protein WD652_02650 [Acidimicrobiia bacterium]